MTVFTDGPRMGPQRGIEDYDVGLGESLGATAAEAWKATPISMLGGIMELGEAQGHFGPPSIPEEADLPIADARTRVRESGLDKVLHLPEQPTIKRAAFDIMLERAKARHEREATIARGPQGFIPGALSIGTSFAVGAVDPLNIAAAFIPVVGEMRYAKILADVGEAALSRLAVRAGAGAVTGGVFTAGLQPLEWAAHTQEGRDFGMSEALRNIIYGAGTFALLHSVGGTASDVYRRYQGRPVYPYAPGEPRGPARAGEAPAPRRPLSEETAAGYDDYVLTDPLGARSDGETLNVQVLRDRDGRIEVLVSDIGVTKVAPAYRDLSAEEAIAHTLGDHLQGSPPDLSKVRRLDVADAAYGERRMPRVVPEATESAAASRKAVYDDVSARLREAGMSPEQADINAEIVAARYAARSARLEGQGGDAFELYRGEGIEIRHGEMMEAEGRAFEQARARLPMDQESRITRAQELGYDTGTVWYTGARRSDRVAERGQLDPRRATAGPMGYLTDSAELASNYAANKPDTSLEAPEDYAGWFKFKAPGVRNPVDIDRAWYHLDPETRRTVAERLPDIKENDDGVITYEPGQGFPAGNLASWREYLRREGQGNPLKTAKEIWLTGGILFNDEARFLEVLRLAGLKDVEFDHPLREQPGVLPVFVRVRNPLRTADTDTLRGLLPELEQLATRSRRRAKPGYDQWHKASVTVRAWVDNLKDDLEHGTTYAWTVVPDEITAFLKTKGYDGILDVSGKGGTEQHNVLIPFEPQQVRSIFARFDQAKAESPRLLDQAARGLGGEPDMFAAREAEGQMQLPGAERIGQGELAQRRADEPLKPKVAQKPMDEGLFGDEPKQKSFFQSERQAPIFYSAVERAVLDTKQERASPDQWLGMLRNRPGVKPEEMEWLGLEGWLKEQKGPVTKQAIADYVRANRIEVTEVTKGEPERIDMSRGEVRRSRFDEDPDYPFEILVDGRLVDRAATREDAEAALGTEIGARTNPPGRTRHSTHVLPGGENYRELLLTLPQDRPADAARIAALETEIARLEAAGDDRWRELSRERGELLRRGGRETFKIRDHFDEPNIVAHARFNDRIIDGKRTLFLEELQSDWHQQGRRKGYRGEGDQAAAAAAADVERWLAEKIAPNARYLNTSLRYGLEHRGRLTVDDVSVPDVEHWAREGVISQDDKAAFMRWSKAAEQAADTVPDAPFKTTWPELLLKRMIRYAAENGYDMLAWTAGKTQAERYDLSKHVDDVRWGKRADGNYDITIYLKDGHTHINHENLSEQQLVDTIGKDATDKILVGSGRYLRQHFEEYADRGNLSGLDLKVGGEGMAGFYDKMLPTAANKLTKKFGGKVERGEVETGVTAQDRWGVRDATDQGEGEIVGYHATREAAEREADELGGSEVVDLGSGKVEVHTLAITPALREAAVSEGFPLFQRAAGGEPRGRISLSTNRAVIDLFTKSDASTFMHEAGHLWLDELIRDASRVAEGTQLRNDLDTILTWLKADKPENLTTEQHEQWARGFERYLAEGNAPSSALRRAFDRFKEWLTTIYKSLTDFNSPITQDVRGVMDRMLATERELAGRPTPIEIIADLPPRAKEDTFRAGAAAMIRGEPVAAGEILAAAAKTDPRVAEAMNGAPAHAPEVPESEIVTKAVGTGRRGPASRDPDTFSLLEFLASNGGIKADDVLAGDVRSLIGKDNKFIPGFGMLLRKNGMPLDRAREAAVEAGYIFDIGHVTDRPSETTINTLLERMDQELRGKRVYREGHEPAAKPGDEDVAKLRHEAEIYLDKELESVEIPPDSVKGPLRDRVLDIIVKERGDALHAYERAVMEEVQNAADAGHAKRIPDEIPGWDVPPEARTAPPAGGPPARLGPSEDAGAGGAPRQPGEADRIVRADDRADQDRLWHELARERAPEDEADMIAASKAAEALPEPPSMEASTRLKAALESEAQAGEIYKAMEAYLPESDRLKLNDTMMRLEQEGRDVEQVLRQGAACLVAAGAGVPM